MTIRAHLVPAHDMSLMPSTSTAQKKRSRTPGKAEKRPSPYQVKFTCRHTGRYISSTKRKLTWHFGFLVDFSNGTDREQDHEIELVWSIKSGKTVLFWNGQDITHLFPIPRGTSRAPPSLVEFTWHSSTGENFEIIARISPPENKPQYDLLIDGVSFFKLPSLNGLCAEQRDPGPECDDNRRVKSLSDVDLTAPTLATSLLLPERSDTLSGDSFSGEAHDSFASVQQHGTEVAAMSIQQGKTYKFDLDDMEGKQKSPKHEKKQCKKYKFDLGGMEDELRSDLYSSRLDLLRDEVAASIPETEGMMSKAIVNAFSEDHDSDTSHDSFSIDNVSEPAELEIGILAETFEWLKWSSRYVSKYDIHDCKLELMQKHVEAIVTHVRHDRLSPHAASEIMLRVASVLRLDVSRELTRDTVVIVGLDSLTTTKDLLEAMSPFGEISSVAICRNYEGYGLCRFTSSTPVEKACDAANQQDIAVLDRKPQIFDLLSAPIASEDEIDVCTHTFCPELTYSFEEDEQVSNLQDTIDPSENAIETSYRSRTPYLHNAMFEPSTSSYMQGTLYQNIP